MAICIISDPHIGIKAFSKKVFNEHISYFEKVFFPYLKKNKINNVLLLGDLVDNRTIIDLYILQELRHRFFHWFEDNMVDLHIIIGNHDTYFKNKTEYNVLTNFADLQFVHCYDHPFNVVVDGVKIAFAPWNSKPLKDDEIDILVGHYDIKDALMQGKSFSKNGLDPEEFKDYPLVLSGHYHKTSQIGNIRYIGSPFQRDYRDFNDEKGFWVYNSGDMKYIKNDFSPKYLKVCYEEAGGDTTFTLEGDGEPREIEADVAAKLAKTNYIRFIIKSYEKQKLLQSFYATISTDSYDRIELLNESTAIVDLDIENLEEIEDEDMEMIDIMGKFVDNVELGQGLDKEVLMKKLKKFHKEAIG